MSVLRLEILTPQGAAFEGEADEVVVPLADGWLGVRPGHAAFHARLTAGEVLVRAHGSERKVATLGGTLIVEPASIVILTGVAHPDRTLEALEQEIGDGLRRLAALEQEAERHFDRVYRQMARAFDRRRRRYA